MLAGPFQMVAAVHDPRSVERWLTLQTQFALWSPTALPRTPPGLSAGDYLSQHVNCLRVDSRNAILAMRQGFIAMANSQRWLAAIDAPCLRHMLCIPRTPLTLNDLVGATQIAGCAPYGFNITIAEVWRLFAIDKPLEDLVYWATGARCLPEAPDNLLVLVVPGK